jgi:hypothetical protein
MSYKPNCWYCNQCDFYVFNSKQACNKCNAPKQNNKCQNQVLNNFDDEMIAFHKREYLKRPTSCSHCKSEGRKYNFEPMRSVHNCWKYS